jgi:single-strand DNA-binding protein
MVAEIAFDGTNMVVLKGSVAGVPRSRELPSGTMAVEFDITTQGSSGSCSAPVVWLDPPRNGALVEAGRAVVVVGVARRRFFRSGGMTQSRTEVVAARVVRAERRAECRRVLDAVAAAILDGPADQRT